MRQVVRVLSTCSARPDNVKLMNRIAGTLMMGVGVAVRELTVINGIAINDNG